MINIVTDKKCALNLEPLFRKGATLMTVTGRGIERHNNSLANTWQHNYFKTELKKSTKLK